jgi:transposase-like protein
MLSVDELFKGRHFDREIIILCVRWYLRFKLSFRDLVEMMAERGVDLSHTTIMRWIQRYVPEFEKRWSRFACKAGRSWRVDETYIKIKGNWTYLYRAVDSEGKTVRAAREFLGEHRHGERTDLRSSKYLNNLIEQDHRSVKHRLGPMLGFKRFRNASITITGIELMHRIRKGQFALGKLRVMGNSARQIWNAALAA